MNIQIYGKSKCFDTKKAQRWFQERRVKFQEIDLLKKGLSPRELQSVKQAVGGLDNLIDPKAKDAATLKYMALESQKEERVLEDPSLLRTPIVRNGKQATVGYCPEIWATWE
jgi:arsenate reductase-like glutaredoxin family protein